MTHASRRPAGPDEDRPWLQATAPVVGVVLAVLGSLLLIQQVFPTAAWPQTAFVFISTIVSASVGTIVTLITMPLLLGTGVALLIAAFVRAMAGNGIGWQALVGAVLVTLGWSA